MFIGKVLILKEKAPGVVPGLLLISVSSIAGWVEWFGSWISLIRGGICGLGLDKILVDAKDQVPVVKLSSCTEIDFRGYSSSGGLLSVQSEIILRQRVNSHFPSCRSKRMSWLRCTSPHQ